MYKGLVIVCLFLCIGCNQKSKTEQAIEKMDIPVEFALFHQDFFTADIHQLEPIKNKYPYMFLGMTSEVIQERRLDSLQNILYSKVAKIYPDFTLQEQEMIDVFKHFTYYIPGFKAPLVVTDITNLSVQDKVLYRGDKLLISLDMYLGKDEQLYKAFSGYLSENFIAERIPVDVALAVIDKIVSYERDRTFLAKMILEGKKLYWLDLVLPQTDDHIKFGCNVDKFSWLLHNEAQVWSYFINQKMLYSTSPKLNLRFLDMAPFSKFYLPIDQQTPGKVGRYIGWQIVKSYIKNKEVSIEALMKTDAQTIFNQSKYKPRK